MSSRPKRDGSDFGPEPAQSETTLATMINVPNDATNRVKNDSRERWIGR
jgi:hypothetical protein